MGEWGETHCMDHGAIALGRLPPGTPSQGWITPPLAQAMNKAPRSALITVRGQDTDLVLERGIVSLKSVAYNLEWVHLPVALVLDAVVDTGATRLTLQVLAPSSRPARASVTSYFWQSYPYTKHIITEDEWRKRDTAALDRTMSVLALPIDFPSHAEAVQWRATLLQAAYPKSKPYRKLLAVCNPASGNSLGKKTLEEAVLPTLRAAGCTVEVMMLERRYDAIDRLLTLDLSPYDALVMIGGDGTMHEIVNGLAGRKDAEEALRLPIVPIPSGSGNAVYVNINGAGLGFQAPLACLSAIKGQMHEQELSVVTQEASLFRNGNPYPLVYKDEHGEYVQYYSFLSHAIGIMAEVDVGTDAFRFMGDLRFVLGYIFGVILNRRCEVDVDVVLGPRGLLDRHTMREPQSHPRRTQDTRHLAYGSVLAPLRRHTAAVPMHPGHAMPDVVEYERAPRDAPWQAIDAPVSSLYGGKMPYVARSFMAFPYASPRDGVLDVLLHNQDSTVMDKLATVQLGETGDHVFEKSVHYFKAEALRVTPHNVDHANTHYLSIDGEMLPYGPFQVEVAPLCIRLLSLSDEEWQAPILGRPAVAAHREREP